ncbi:hypothetical protein THRCLA_04526 [Thraustotheca clavata]|uniref:Uncharacterized protein n=1 Tax=Thraustotheca clavata TaxID=74557 RepID=A0A1V9ZYT4_9STRA|nr:hypothetical protein THRCLA_04526 [Thraustotheca clavata]
MSDCTHELEELLLEVYESLETDGVDLLLPDHIARKLHGMVHLHRSCSQQYSMDFVDVTSCLDCGKNQEEVEERHPELVMERPELVVEGVWRNEHPELVIEGEENYTQETKWMPQSNNDRPELVIELEGTKEEAPEVDNRHEPMCMVKEQEHPVLVIEEPTNEVDEQCNMHPVLEISAVDATSTLSPSFTPMPVIEEEDFETASIVSTLDLTEVADKAIVPMPVIPQSPESQSMQSDDETVTSIDFDFEQISSLNNEYDEFFEFMHQELEPETTSTRKPSASCELPSTTISTRYSPGFDSTDDESDDDEPLLITSSPLLTKIAIESMPCPAPIALAKELSTKSPLVQPAKSIRQNLKIDLPYDKTTTSPLLMSKRAASLSPHLTSKSAPAQVKPTPPTRRSSAPTTTTARAVAAPTTRSSHGSTSSSQKTGVTPLKRTMSASSVHNSTPKRNGLATSHHPSNPTATLKRTMSASSLHSTATTSSTRSAVQNPQYSSVTTTRGGLTPRKSKEMTTPRKLTTPTTPRSSPSPKLPPTPKAASTPRSFASTPRAANNSAEQRHEVALKRREEKERREAALREEAHKMREERRALVEAKHEQERQHRAELLKKRQLEREQRIHA